MRNFYKSKLLLLKPNKIVCSLNTLRKYYDDYDIKSLADNIAVNGIIEPLIVTENDAGKYELVAGLKRLKACELLRFRRVPCLVIEADEEECAFISLSENIKRTSLNFYDEAKAIKQIINRYEISNSAVAERLGISSSALINKLNLLEINADTMDRIIRSGLTERHARIVLLIPEKERELFLDRVIRDELNVSETKELAERFLLGIEDEKKSGNPAPPPIRKVVIGDARLFANSLAKLIDTMRQTGLEAYSKKTENDKYIEYKIRIVKPQAENYKQLKLV